MRSFHNDTRLIIVIALACAVFWATGGCPQNTDGGLLSPTDTQQDAPQAGQNDASGETSPPSGDESSANDEPSAPTSQALDGPGFNLTIPPGFTLMSDEAPLPAYSFWRAYQYEFGDTLIMVGVLGQWQGASSSTEDFTMRLKGAVVTAAGDFLLTARMKTDQYAGDEIEAAYGMLADGRALIIMVGSSWFSGEDELAAQTVFRSVDLEGTDGRDLEDAWRAAAPELIVKTDNDMFVLSDMSVWRLPSSASYADQSEALSWRVGDHLIPQMVTEYFLDQEELIHVGNWRPIDADFMDFASHETIAGFPDATSVMLSDGSVWTFSVAVPPTWDIGDFVFIVSNDYLGEWLIHEQSGLATLFY